MPLVISILSVAPCPHRQKASHRFAPLHLDLTSSRQIWQPCPQAAIRHRDGMPGTRTATRRDEVLTGPTPPCAAVKEEEQPSTHHISSPGGVYPQDGANAVTWEGLERGQPSSRGREMSCQSFAVERSRSCQRSRGEGREKVPLCFPVEGVDGWLPTL